MSSTRRSEHLDPVLGKLRREKFDWAAGISLPRLGRVTVLVNTTPIAPKQHAAYQLVARVLDHDFGSIERAIVTHYQLLQTIVWQDDRELLPITASNEIWKLLSEPSIFLPVDYEYFVGPIGVLAWCTSWDCERAMYAVIVENSCIGATTDFWTVLMDDWLQAR